MAIGYAKWKTDDNEEAERVMLQWVHRHNPGRALQGPSNRAALPSD